MLREGEILEGLVHDLRQPLGNIEVSAFFLDLILDRHDARVHEQLRMIEQQVAKAQGMLKEATDRIRCLRTQGAEEGGAASRTATSESRALTNPASAVVV